LLARLRGSRTNQELQSSRIKWSADGKVLDKIRSWTRSDPGEDQILEKMYLMVRKVWITLCMGLLAE